MINFNKTIDRTGIATIVLVVIVAFFTYPANAETTYTPPQNIYLPEMMFLVVKDTDSLGITRCKNMAYRTVDSFSRRENSNLVRADKKLNTLARIIYNECIDVTIDAHRKGL